MPTRLAQGGVALGLVLSMGAVVVTADGAEPTPTSVVDPDAALARASAERAATAYAAQLRVQAVDAAQAAVEQVSRVRSDATEVAVPDDVLAELDAATAALQDAIAEVDAQPVIERRPSVSRSEERAGADVTPTPAPSTTTPATAGTTAATVGPPAETASPEAAEPPAAEALTEATLPDTTDPATTPLRIALDRVRQAAQVVLSTTEQKKAEAAAAQVAAEVAAAEAERVATEQAAQRAAWKASLRGYANGQIPSSALCGVSFDSSALLRCDAAEALDALDAAFAARFGTHLTISDSYRSYAGQVACRASKGSLCAAPGTSNHGWGLAVDLGGSVQTFGTAQHQWMRENAPSFQWTLPEWARAGGSKPEPWHWEYVG
ncbi:M15 family metallopeptidase [Cellulomonas phragmiteti]|uniref:D-alanyl-D-alanine carboxypeptidase-like core domain-containing protein n=1 Tax=Cellulomonas phragmiteti TaxID=478780 RepID=A0ABQ4DND8_9CELL|nr:M15 family metallopeptidase [Cellulomonas phragmiteti]GIG40876.1 hypothetical protein Cph01nite_26380 [Cellulomonas phragmiteti]